MKKAIFLDRDGTLNVDHGYVYKIADWEWIPGVLRALSLLTQAGFNLVVVSNQSGIARNMYTEEDLCRLESHVSDELMRHSITITAWYHCPHLPDISGPCTCRKPLPGMLLRAISEHKLDPAASWMIGDALRDIQAGIAAQVQTIKLGDGTRLEDQEAKKLGALIFPGLLEAAEWLCTQ